MRTSINDDTFFIFAICHGAGLDPQVGHRFDTPGLDHPIFYSGDTQLQKTLKYVSKIGFYVVVRLNIKWGILDISSPLTLRLLMTVKMR